MTSDKVTGSCVEDSSYRADKGLVSRVRTLVNLQCQE